MREKKYVVEKDDGEGEETDEIAIVLKVDMVDDEKSGSKQKKEERSERLL